MSPSTSPRASSVQSSRVVSPEDIKGSGASTSTVATTVSTSAEHLSPVSADRVMMPDDPEATLRRLRLTLDEAQQRDATAKAALAKSDAVILELRSSVRQLKRQLESLNHEKEDANEQIDQLSRELSNMRQSAEKSSPRQQQPQDTHQPQARTLESEMMQISNVHVREQVVGELQVQLDRAHAQILTADMVRKELEDTLEAEQYTWELRVQDQERQLAQLQQECATLREDLEQCRSQWKEAEVGWTRDLQELQRDLDASHQELMTVRANNGESSGVQKRIEALETERRELQSCLDEAMQELEAVDAELRRDPNVVEPLQHLYRWLQERNDDQDHSQMPQETGPLLEGIQDMIENAIGGPGSDSLRVAELEAQVSVFRGDLKAREESASELRGSLKEAVGLLKPLQDAVAKSDREKIELERQLEELKSNPSRERNDEIEKLKTEVRQLHEELKGRSPRKPMMQSSNEEGHEQQKESARAKRKAEMALQKMLSQAQSRFHELHQANHDIVLENKELQNKLDEAEKELYDQKSLGEEDVVQRDVAAEMRERTIAQLEEEVNQSRLDISARDDELEDLRSELRRVQQEQPTSVEETKRMEERIRGLQQQVAESGALKAEVHSLRENLKTKTQSEQVLNESLIEALNLLKPLQAHLETAEQEKRELAKQLRSYRRRIAKLENQNSSVASSRSTGASFAGGPEGWDPKARYLEATKSKFSPQRGQSNLTASPERLKSAEAQNRALADRLKQKERSEKDLSDEVTQLRAQLQASEKELENAKYIATSALVKVEELTMAKVQSKR